MLTQTQIVRSAAVQAARTAAASPRGTLPSISAAPVLIRIIAIAQLIELLPKIQRQLGPHLIHPRYRKARPKNADSSWGCCYPATEALYHLWGKRFGFKPHYIRMKTGCHWFLRNKAGQVIDPTVLQFKRTPDYSTATGAGFLTKEPSRRARAIMEAL